MIFADMEKTAYESTKQRSEANSFGWFNRIGLRQEMEPPVRFELTTVRLQGECSTN